MKLFFVHFQARSTFHFPDHATVVITIADMNDNQPVFSNRTYWFAIAENSDIGAIVGQVKATDTDQVSSYRSHIIFLYFFVFGQLRLNVYSGNETLFQGNSIVSLFSFCNLDVSLLL